jgi:hypothetical protein
MSLHRPTLAALTVLCGLALADAPSSNPGPTPSPQHGTGRAGEGGELLGEWLLKLPAGFEFEVSIVADERPDHFVVRGKKATNLLGVYKLGDGKLCLVTPQNAQMAGLVWEVKDRNTLLLVEQSEKKRPADYRGAILSRQDK